MSSFFALFINRMFLVSFFCSTFLGAKFKFLNSKFLSRIISVTSYVLASLFISSVFSTFKILCILFFSAPPPLSPFLVCVRIREPSPTGNTLQVRLEQSEFCILKPLKHVLFVMHIVCLLNILTELLFILGFT